MRTTKRQVWLVLGGAAALIVGTSACPVPMRYTERLAPALIGVVRTDSGAPLGGLVLAVSLRPDCRQPIAVDTTNAAGVFNVPASDRERRLAWVGPFEFPPPVPFYLCADSAHASRVAYTGGVPVLPTRKPPLPVDSLFCTQSQREAQPVLRCESRTRQPK